MMIDTIGAISDNVENRRVEYSDNVIHGRQPTGAVRSVLRTLSVFLATTAIGLSSVSSPRLQSECLAASVRWQVATCKAADLDGDLQPDFTLSEQQPGSINPFHSVSVHLSRGETAQELVLPAGRSALSISLRDVDGDGDLDIVLIGGLNQTVGVFINDGNGNFSSDEQDRYVTAPSTAGTGLGAPRSPDSCMCGECHKQSGCATARDRESSELLHLAPGPRAETQSIHPRRLSAPHQSRAP